MSGLSNTPVDSESRKRRATAEWCRLGFFAIAIAVVLVGCQDMVSDPEPPARGDVHVITEEDLESDVTSVGDASVSFAEPTDYSEGDVLVAGITMATPDGMLRKVTSVSADGKTVGTAPATIEDAITEGTLTIQGRLSPADLTEQSRAAIEAAGMSLTASRAAATEDCDPTNEDDNIGCGEFSFDLRIPETTFVQGSSALKLSGSVKFSLEYYLTARYSFGLKDVEFYVKPSASTTLNVDQVLSVRGLTGTDLRASVKIPGVLPMYFTPVPVVVAGVPVVFTPVVELYIGLDTVVALSADVTSTASLKVGAECDSSCGKVGNWRPIVDPTFDFKVEELTIGGTIRAYVAPRFSFNLYDVAGPWVELQAYAAASAAGGVVAGEPVTTAGLYAGVDAAVGAHVKVPILGGTLVDLNFGDFGDDDDNNRIEVFGPVLWASGGSSVEGTWEWRGTAPDGGPSGRGYWTIAGDTVTLVDSCVWRGSAEYMFSVPCPWAVETTFDATIDETTLTLAGVRSITSYARTKHGELCTIRVTDGELVPPQIQSNSLPMTLQHEADDDRLKVKNARGEGFDLYRVDEVPAVLPSGYVRPDLDSCPTGGGTGSGPPANPVSLTTSASAGAISR